MHCVGGSSGSCFVGIGDVSTKDVEAGMANDEASIVIVLGKYMFGHDCEDLLTRVGE